VVLLSRNQAYSVRSLVIVASVTTRIRHISSEVPIGYSEGMPQECVANLDTITTIPKDCLRSRLTSLNPKKLKEIDAAIHFTMGMEEVICPFPVTDGSV
jgi:mRNA interferase MazF